jgi:3-oxoacyl-[acyl-carrier-protein] synthase III
MTYPFTGEFKEQADSQTFKTNYKLLTEEQIPYSFPFFTIGEAATATILSAEVNDNFKFSFTSKPEFSELCTIPMENYEGYSEMDGGSGCNGAWSFTSHGLDMHKMGKQEAINVFQQLSLDPEDIDVVLVHSSSKREWEISAQAVGLKDKVFFTYSETGNVVSASIPTALVMAEKAGKLMQGDRVLCWMGSAGMSFSAYSFIY